MRAYYGPEADTKRILQMHNDLFSTPPRIVALDVETISLKDQTVIGVAIAISPQDVFYYDMLEPSVPWHLIQPSRTRKIWHNAVFDLSWEALGKFGADIDNIDDSIIVCRMIPEIENNLEEASYSVATQTSNMGDLLREFEEKLVINLPRAEVAKKCALDALATFQVFEKYRSSVSDEYYETERQFLLKLLKMSHTGIRLDSGRVQAIDRELEGAMALFYGTAEGYGYNPNSPAQVAAILNARGHFLPADYRTKKPKTGEEILERINDPVAQLTILARKYRKMHERTHKWLDKERSFAHYKMDGNTGRTSSYDENHQNLPTGKRKGDIIPQAGPIRSVFLPDDEQGTRWDLNQIELRVLAYLSGDTRMTAILNDPTRKIHRETQEALGLESYIDAKTFNFAMIYLAEDQTIARNIRMWDMGKIAQLRNAWQATFPQAWGYIESVQEEALRTLMVETLYGRKLDISHTQKSLTEKHIRSCAVNWPIQGTAAEIFKRVSNAAQDLGVPIESLRSQIHDEFWLDGRHELDEKLAYLAPFWTPIESHYVRRFSDDI